MSVNEYVKQERRKSLRSFTVITRQVITRLTGTLYTNTNLRECQGSYNVTMLATLYRYVCYRREQHEVTLFNLFFFKQTARIGLSVQLVKHTCCNMCMCISVNITNACR